MLVFRTLPVLAALSEILSPSLRSPRNAVAVAATVAAVGGVAWYLLRKPRPTAEEMERSRREQLAANGRITDGSITETAEGHIHHPADTEATHATPQVIVYNYRIAGVSYEAAQDVTTLSELVRDVRTDLPIQVRYEPHNPANSIVVAETWSGLRLSAELPRPVLGIDRYHGSEG
ncbi:DUF3592 domain-containing protein [Edaphobacter flagellatus]|uniref:DUF3592 domain-containing protein n=1 Tax=Edaphobacter flagellatus TaxID=1933044 RepID=UPI0021B26BDE|nr:DUF3592 domain-containing protein [Edaphobacter flagellatus]